MSRIACAVVLALAAIFAIPPTAHAAVEIRFHPASAPWQHDIDAARGYASVVIHNTAIVNRGDTSATPTRVVFDVLRAGEVILSQTLASATLDKAAAQGAGLQQGGLLDILAFQFAPKKLLGDGVKLEATRTLAPNNALLIASQLLVFKAPADHVRVSVFVDGDDKPTVAELALRGTAAPLAMRFPVKGRWLVGAGATPHTHHRWVTGEEFALDIAKLGASGGTYAGKGDAMKDYYGWDAPVLAAADGEIVAVVDSHDDNVAMLRRADESIVDYRKRLFAAQDELLVKGVEGIPGNLVVIRHEGDLYSMYAHLKAKSTTVKVGQRVKAGARVGSLGSSGNSTEPHLHFQVCDTPRPLDCAGVPVRFSDIELPWAERDRQLQSGDMIETR
jgi:murein DD-endopeptidase MepM/ murein hydrolase activator NlpD